MPVEGLDLIARPLLAPLLLWQGLRLRRRALVLPEPPGPRHGSAGEGPALRVLILGDSSAAGVGAPSQDLALSGRLVAELAQGFRVDWRLEAATGATTADTLTRVRGLPPLHFDVAVVALGVNDTTRFVPRAVWLRRQRALVRLLRDRFGLRCILLSGLPPMGAYPVLPQPLRWILGAQAARLDRALAGLAAREQGVLHLPLDIPFEPRLQGRDGYHPSVAAYALWARLVAGRLCDALPADLRTPPEQAG